MDVLIKDLCRERKNTLNYTNQEIADEANMSVNTVNTYFSNASKAPSVYTVGPICAALGVSLDKYFGIKSEESPVEQSEQLSRISILEKRCQDFEKDIAHLNDIINLKDMAIKDAREEVRRRRPIIYLLLFLSILTVGAFIAYLLHFDLTNPSYGLFRG